MFTTLEIVLIAVIVYMIIGIGILCLISKDSAIELDEILLTIFLWITIPFILIHNKLKKIIE